MNHTPIELETLSRRDHLLTSLTLLVETFFDENKLNENDPIDADAAYNELEKFGTWLPAHTSDEFAQPL